jgi:hypothetical protein
MSSTKKVMSLISCTKVQLNVKATVGFVLKT